MAEAGFSSLVYRDGAWQSATLTDEGPVLHARVEGDFEGALAAWRHEPAPAGTWSYLLPSEKVMCFTVDAPTVDDAEIDGMVALQAEEMSPWPSGRAQVAWELMERGEGRSRVLAALASMPELDAVRAAFAAAGRSPDRIDVEALAWLRLLSDAGLLAADESELLLWMEDNRACLIVWQNGTPALIRPLPNLRSVSAEELRDELTQSLLGLGKALNPGVFRRLRIWHDGEAPAWASAVLDEWEMEFHLIAELPSVTEGAVRRAAESGRLNLAPRQWREETHRYRSRRQRLRLLVAVAALWLLLLGGFAAWIQFSRLGVERLEAENRKRAATVTEVQALSDQVRSLSQFTRRETTALDTLLLLASAVPGSGSLVMEDLRYGKADGISFSGRTAGDVQIFYQFLENLGQIGSLRVKDYDLKEARTGFTYRVNAIWERGQTEASP